MPRPTRRQFLQHLAGLTGSLALPWATPDAIDRWLGADRAPADPVRVSGRVVAGGSGVGGVAVTDGRSVVQTQADGRFEMAASARQPFVYLSVPAGYRIPQHDTGTARPFVPLDADGGETLETRFDLEPLDRSDEAHAFVVLADPQTETEAEMQKFHNQTVPDVRSTVGELGDRPVFGVGCGDLVFDDLSFFDGYERAVERMGIPFWQVVGNHDLDFEATGDPGSTATFRQTFGPTYYSFDRGAVHYVVLDDVFWPGSDGFGGGTDDYLGYLDHAQLEWLRQDLSLVESGRPVVVFTHIPPLSTAYERQGEASPGPRGQVKNREALYALLEPFESHVISGHVHENEHRTDGSRHEHVIGTACGAWWSGPICYDGTPKGYAVYEADGTSLSWRYRSTGKSADHQMRVYPRGADPEAPDEVVANVWDADEEWTVVWYEDGERRGEMAQRTGTDPLSERLHRGDDRPSRRPWVDPLPTDHLFYAPVRDDVSTVRVEATDRFGRTVSATVDPSASMGDAVEAAPDAGRSGMRGG
jgi:hypothetical protein